jgi:uncharacterized metal-binding protein
MAIDGCDIGWAKAILDHADVPIKNYLVLTGLGIEKNKDFNLKREGIDTVKETVKKLFGEPQSAQTSAGLSTASCCS